MSEASRHGAPGPWRFRPAAALLGLLLVPGLHAEEPSLLAEVDKTSVSMEDTLTLRLILSGARASGRNPEIPPIPGFRVSFAGQSQSVQLYDGRLSSSLVYTYALQPLAPGDHQIPAITVRAGDKVLATAPIAVKVTAPPPGSADPARPETSVPAGETRDLFVTAETDKKSAFVGEPVIWTFRFYTRVALLSQPAYAPPALSGFFQEDLPPQRQYRAQVGGRVYNVVELRNALFPTGAGRFSIGSATLECSVQDFARDPFGGSFPGFFDQFMGGGRRLTLRTDPISVQVKPLPETGRPADFQGDVGRYAIGARLDRRETDVHGPVTLTVTVEGEGHVKSLGTPALPALPEFKVYETLKSLNLDKSSGRVRGSRVFTTVLKPVVSGTLTVPAIRFSFFDPAAGGYRTVETKPLRLAVRPSATAPDASSAPDSPGLQVVQEDIRFIKSGGRVAPVGRPFPETGAFLALQALPGFLFLGVWGVERRKSAERADVRGRAFRRAARDATAALARARAKPDGAYVKDLQEAVLGYWAAKIGVNPQGLVWEDVAGALGRLGAPPELQAAASRVWDELDRLRYTPGRSERSEAESLAGEFLGILKEVDRLWRR